MPEVAPDVDRMRRAGAWSRLSWSAGCWRVRRVARCWGRGGMSGAGVALRVGGSVAAAAGAVSGLRGHACAAAGSVLFAAPGRGRGDRRGDRGACCRGGVSADRGAVGGAGGHGPWLAAQVRGRAGLIRALFTRCAVALDPGSGRWCRPAAASRTRWRRSRSRPGRGCCGSGGSRCGGSSAACRRAGCCRATRVPSRQGRGELRRSGARASSVREDRGGGGRASQGDRTVPLRVDPACVEPGLSKAERGRLVRALAEASISVRTGGSFGLVARRWMSWIRAYREGGFEALVPRPRVVAPRTPAGVLELAFQLKRERPERTAAQVLEIMLAAGEAGPGCGRCRPTWPGRG